MLVPSLSFPLLKEVLEDSWKVTSSRKQVRKKAKCLKGVCRLAVGTHLDQVAN